MTTCTLYGLITRSPNWEDGLSLHTTYEDAETAMRDKVIATIEKEGYDVDADDVPAGGIEALDVLHEHGWDGAMTIEAATVSGEDLTAMREQAKEPC